MEILLFIIIVVGLVNFITKLLPQLPFAVFFLLRFIVLLPAMPFIAAYRCREVRPLLSRTLIILWLSVYLLLAFLVTVY